MTDLIGQRLEHIIDRLEEVGPHSAHLDILDELATQLLQAHRRIQALERLLLPVETLTEAPRGISGHSIGQRLKAATADVVATPPTFTSTTQEPA